MDIFPEKDLRGMEVLSKAFAKERGNYCCAQYFPWKVVITGWKVGMNAASGAAVKGHSLERAGLVVVDDVRANTKGDRKGLLLRHRGDKSRAFRAKRNSNSHNTQQR